MNEGNWEFLNPERWSVFLIRVVRDGSEGFSHNNSRGSRVLVDYCPPGRRRYSNRLTEYSNVLGQILNYLFFYVCNGC